MKKLTSLVLLASAVAASAQTNSGSFFNTVSGYFTTFNPSLTNTFAAKTTLWTGVDSQQGSGSSLANEIGASYNVYGPLSLESVTRDGGVSGTLVSEQFGLGLNFIVVDTRLTLYGDAGYKLDSPTGSKFQDNLYGEIGIRVAKALTEHTFAWVGIGAQFPTKAQVFEGGVGFTF